MSTDNTTPATLREVADLLEGQAAISSGDVRLEQQLEGQAAQLREIADRIEADYA